MSARPEAREWRRRERFSPVENMHLAALPTTPLGEWLRTGPRTMPRELRNRLERLKLFAQACYENLGIAHKGRAYFLETPDVFCLFLKVSYAQERIERLNRSMSQRFLALVPKSATFSAGRVIDGGRGTGGDAA